MNTSAIILSVLMLFSMSFAPYAGAEEKMPGSSEGVEVPDALLEQIAELSGGAR